MRGDGYIDSRPGVCSTVLRSALPGLRSLHGLVLAPSPLKQGSTPLRSRARVLLCSQSITGS